MIRRAGYEERMFEALFGFLFGDEGATLAPLPSGDVPVVLEEVGERKIAVIKAVREITGLGLAETKRLVESAPAVVARVGTASDGREAVARLRQAGAVARVGDGGTMAPSGAGHHMRLRTPGPNVIATIKVLRDATGCGLREAKAMVDGAPTTLGPFPTERSLALLVALTDIGADAEIE